MRLPSACAAIILSAPFLAVAAAPAKIDFQRDVRPILSDACFHCHGPDSSTRMAGLRLDQRADATAERKSGRAVVPGDPAQSLLWQRVNTKTAAKLMPPAYSHKTLTADQKDILRRWIEEGAGWKEHWAFSKPVKAPLPAVKNAAWPRSPLDRFLLARMEAAGLAPNAEADPRTLIRRVALDLTGLPPTPEVVAAYLDDKSPGAYERMVDRYLASPRYGEHRARYWLDAARYADTHGIHIDNYREMWPYRDWVINAFNRNLSFDRFTIEQIAGDLLPNRTLEQQVATGFHRCAPTTNEAGAIEDEFAAIYAKDRVDTTGAVWLGMTIGCATCHDHKFDPITQRDFYSMAAFFRNTTQPVMDGNILDTPPVIAVPEGQDRARWELTDRQRGALLDQLRKLEAAPGAGFEAWLRGPSRRDMALPLAAASQSFRLQLGSSLEGVYGRLPQTFELGAGVTLGDSSLPGVPALRFDKESRQQLPYVPDIQADKPFSISAWYQMPTGEGTFTIASMSDPKDKGRGWVFDVSGRVPGLRLVGDNGKSIGIRGMFLVQTKPGTWNHVTVTYDGSRDQTGFALYVNGQRAMIAGGGRVDRLKGPINTAAPLRLGNDATRYFATGAIGDFRLFTRALTEEEARALAAWPVALAARAKDASQLTEEERQAFRRLYLVNHDPLYMQISRQRLAIDEQRTVIARTAPLTHVMEERKDQKPFAHVLNRGMYDQPKDRVEPATPSVLPPMKKEYPRNRLGLAQWLMDPDNPMPSRVTVNRFWQEIFGAGLVKTAEDFGSQGEVPSHPELLDWLAVEFRESGWDMKRFFRTLVTSAAYRQAATVTPEKIKADPENRLLARGPRFRLDGEVLRDSALAASGLLSARVGGASVKPYQPTGVWEAVAMDGSNTRFYKQDEGDGLYRRSLYWFWKRSAPPASLDIFNAPTRELCTVRRERTNTPLQALVVMNDPQFVEAARALAERALKNSRSQVEGQFEFIAQRLLARPFNEKETGVLRASYRDYLRYYDSNPADAKKLISVGASKPDDTLPPPEFAALTMVASQVMNLDEAVTK
jgi:hypothetical protein